MKKLNEEQVTNAVEGMLNQPFSVKIKLQGTQDILFHRWNNEVVEAKAAAKKGSKEKKTEDPETYVYRNDEKQICIPGRYIVRSVVEAGRNFQDPRSSRKMAKDLVQAAVMCDEILSPILVGGKPTTEWDYDDRQRVCIMRSAITRTRPAFKKGWEVNFTLVSLVPEYITPDFLRKLVDNAGLLIGLGDFRPTYGRFRVTHWEQLPYVSAEAI
ncbi:MAG: hypothetical protein IJP96_11185 [Synergistaceae bacterium]|nr:hypothetical protein [Synergistaceae bacterium]MBR0033410.1 hypothetical protein [Bacilli bacterium]MBR0076305.1 hypothetical protein [Synergistaceae bacterium]